jgi:hypothetical protein
MRQPKNSSVSTLYLEGVLNGTEHGLAAPGKAVPPQEGIVLLEPSGKGWTLNKPYPVSTSRFARDIRMTVRR